LSCVIALLLGVAGGARAGGDAPAPVRDGYVVLPFVNASGVKALDWMASALPITVA